MRTACFPHSRAIDEGGLEEERRLFYVGVTRAMRQLYLTYARRRAVFGAQTNGMRSRFLDEIPAELLEEPQRACRAGEPARASGAFAPAEAARAWRAAWPCATRPLRPGRQTQRARGRAVRAFRLGEDVVHAAFGEGVVTAREPDGVIVVRFAGDGSERKLMAEYAPVSRR